MTYRDPKKQYGANQVEETSLWTAVSSIYLWFRSHQNLGATEEYQRLIKSWIKQKGECLSTLNSLLLQISELNDFVRFFETSIFNFIQETGE